MARQAKDGCMKILRLNPAGLDRKYCFVDGAFPYDTALQQGGPVLDEMKQDGVDALEYRLDEAKGGLKVGDYFRTNSNHLPVSMKFAHAVSTRFNLGPHEIIPARIRNEKGRIHVREMAIVNPLVPIDCLDWTNSEMDGDTENPLVRIFGKWSLRSSGVVPELDLFRVKGLIGYLFSERLTAFLAEQQFENFKFDEAHLS